MKRTILIVGLLLAGSGFYYYLHVIPRNHDGKIILYGNIDIRDVSLGFRTFGRLEHMKFEEGDRIKKGDLLASIDKAPNRDRLKAAKADVEDKTVALKNASQTYDRKLQLIKSKTTSQQSYDDALADKNRALAALHAAEANMAEAMLSLEDTDIFAPSDGTILTRVREPGAIVNPGESIYVLAVDDPVWVRAYISETDLGKIFPGMKAKVFADSHADKPYEGQIGFISPVAEFTPKTVETTELRTKLVYRVRIIIMNQDRYLRQGMPVTVKIDPGAVNDHHQ